MLVVLLVLIIKKFILPTRHSPNLYIDTTGMFFPNYKTTYLYALSLLDSLEICNALILFTRFYQSCNTQHLWSFMRYIISFSFSPPSIEFSVRAHIHFSWYERDEVVVNVAAPTTSKKGSDTHIMHITNKPILAQKAYSLLVYTQCIHKPPLSIFESVLYYFMDNALEEQ